MQDNILYVYAKGNSFILKPEKKKEKEQKQGVVKIQIQKNKLKKLN